MSFQLESPGRIVNANGLGSKSIVPSLAPLPDDSALVYNQSIDKFEFQPVPIEGEDMVFDAAGGVTVSNGIRFDDSDVVLERVSLMKVLLDPLASMATRTDTVTFDVPFSPNPPRVYVYIGSDFNTTLTPRTDYVVYNVNPPTLVNFQIQLQNLSADATPGPNIILYVMAISNSIPT